MRPTDDATATRLVGLLSEIEVLVLALRGAAVAAGQAEAAFTQLGAAAEEYSHFRRAGTGR